MTAILCMALSVVSGAPPVATHKASDVALIANWLSGKDAPQAFAKPFGDAGIVADGKEALFYTDVPDAETPAGMKAADYEFIQARMRRIRAGHKAAPAVLIVRSSLEEPADDGPELVSRPDKRKPGCRVYYVEVAIGNMAWHWLKVVVRDEGNNPKADVLWTKVS